jgi:predicted amidophosphoribosyltransferase
VLVDDVMTTGATLIAAAQCLQECGVSDLHVWVLARTPSPHEPSP